jgi:hypothetical protein
MTARQTVFVTLVVALVATSLSLALARWAAGDLATLVWEGRREEALAERLAASSRTLQEKAVVVENLIAGRVTLREAAGRFRELHDWVGDDPNNGILGPYLVMSGEEGLWRNVLCWVEAELRHRRDRTPGEVLRRLLVQYRQQFGNATEPFPGFSLRPETFEEPSADPAPVESLPANGDTAPMPESVCSPCLVGSALNRSPAWYSFDPVTIRR